MKGRLSFLKRHTSRSSRPYEEEGEGRDRELKEIQLSSVAQKKSHAVNHTGRCGFLNKISGIRSQTIGKKSRNGKWYVGEGIGDGMRMKYGWRKFFFFSLNSLQAALKPLIHRRGHAYRESRTNVIVYIKDAEEKKQGSTSSRSTTG